MTDTLQTVPLPIAPRPVARFHTWPASIRVSPADLTDHLATEAIVADICEDIKVEDIKVSRT